MRKPSLPLTISRGQTRARRRAGQNSRPRRRARRTRRPAPGGGWPAATGARPAGPASVYFVGGGCDWTGLGGSTFDQYIILLSAWAKQKVCDQNRTPHDSKTSLRHSAEKYNCDCTDHCALPVKRYFTRTSRVESHITRISHTPPPQVCKN